MQHPFAMTLLVACIPTIVAACRLIGPGPTARYAILGVFLLMPRYDPNEKVFGIFTFDKLTVAGLSMLVGVILFDRKTLARARLHWVDSPMCLYVAAPLISSLCQGGLEFKGSVDQSWRNLAEWGIPYALGRLYYADLDGPRRLAISIILGALCYIPFCAYEMVMGNGWFLRPVLFGIPTDAAFRLGGWRPEVMLTTGLELVTWMALSTVVAFWLWSCRECWRTRYLPAWLPPIALLLTTIAGRGIYGYVTLGLGLASIALLLLTRSRWVLIPLLVAPLLYIGLRASGVWNGQGLLELARLAGEREFLSVRFRIVIFEDQFIREFLSGNLLLGLGGLYADSWADGWWLMLLKRGGLLGLAAHYSAFLLPAALAIFRKSSRRPSASVEIGFALFLILLMIDSLHNTSLIAVSTLIGGSLTGVFLAQSRSSVAGRSMDPGTHSSTHATYRIRDLAARPAEAVDVRGQLGFVLSVACLLYIFGHGRVAGHEGAVFVGGLGAALLFGAVGAFVAGSPRRLLAWVTLFGLAFGVLGITLNLAMHPAARAVWSADILQGMALSGIVIAAWRRATGGGPWAFAGLTALVASGWAFEASLRPFWGSQYLFMDGADGQSLFPVFPWLALASIGAALVGMTPAGCSVLAIGFGLSALLVWNQGPPFGPPNKFPLNATYALLGASLVSGTFALSSLARRSKPIRFASAWLGRRWLVFFYVHMGIAVGLARVGLMRPIVVWSALAGLSIAATWLISVAADRIRPVFRRTWAWAILGLLTLSLGLTPGVPGIAVLGAAGAFGLIFAALHDDLANLMLGPALAEPHHRSPSPDAGESTQFLAKVGLVVAFLVAPELVARLPFPFGTAARPQPPDPTKADAPSPAGLKP